MNRKIELIVSTPDKSVENRYEVEWPTIDQIIQIEALKLQLSRGKYTEMLLASTRGAERALNYIDMCSYLSVMCPKLIKDLKVDIRNLDTIDVDKGLMKVYVEQFIPWWNQYEDAVKVEDSSEDDKGGDK